MNILSEPMDNLKEYTDKYQELNNSNNLVSIMNHEGQRVKVSPTTLRVIFPHKLQNLYLNPKTSKFELHPDFIKENVETVPDYTEMSYPDMDNSESNIIQEGGASKEELELALREKDEMEAKVSNFEDTGDNLENFELSTRESEIDPDILEIMSIDKKKELKENNLVESPISSEDANMTEEEKEELAKNRKQSDSGNETSSLEIIVIQCQIAIWMNPIMMI